LQAAIAVHSVPLLSVLAHVHPSGWVSFVGGSHMKSRGTGQVFGWFPDEEPGGRGQVLFLWALPLGTTQKKKPQGRWGSFYQIFLS